MNTAPTHPLVLNLIIASENEPYYLGLMNQWSRYMNIHPNIVSWFIRFQPSLSKPHVFDGNTLWIKGREDGFLIYEKTAKALQICLSLPEYLSIEYVIRTNLSSFYIWDRVMDHLKTAPKHQYITSRIITQTRDNVPYPSGCGMIMSRDVAELWAIDTITPEKQYLSDDWAFGYTPMRHRISIQPALCYMIKDEWIERFKESPVLNELNGIYHVRVKAGTENHRRTYEVENYSYLVDNFYGK